MRSLSVALLLAVGPAALAQTPPKKAALKPGVRVAVVGDSITEQKQYSKFIADYLAACYPRLDAHVVQFGWGGETAAGFLARMDNDLLPFRPDVVTLCYGMNDGGYTAFRPDIGQRYEKPLAEIVRKCKAAGATVVVGSPGCVDQYWFGKDRGKEPGGQPTPAARTYNDTLGHLRDIAKRTAEAADQPFANVHDTMKEAMLAAQEMLGAKYHVGGSDGVHPAPNGQLAMATAFLSALDLDGDLGTVTIDPKGESTAGNGHTIIKAEGGSVAVESKRYPFALSGDPESPNGTRSIAPFLLFNDRFNRLTLVVKNAPADRVKVTWGDASKTFTRADLEKGVNLAAAFADHPLVGPFRKVDQLVADQQEFQTFMIKSVITHQRGLLGRFRDDAEVFAAAKAIADKMWSVEAKKQAAVRAAVVPVLHTITVAAAE